MEQLFLIAPIAVPVLFWAVYHYYKDRHLPEPVGHLAFTFLLGIAAAWISTALYSGLDWVGLRFDAGYLADTSSWALLAYSLLAIGPIEELAKLLPFLIVVLRFKEFDEPMDGIIYASFIGLGYAAIENWHCSRQSGATGLARRTLRAAQSCRQHSPAWPSQPACTGFMILS